MAAFGLEARMSADHRLDGYPAPLYFTVAAIALFFASGGLRMIRSGGLTGARRLARHAGRMGFGLFLAAGSFFIGQQKVMPLWMHGSPILFVLGLAPLALTIFWLIRIRLTGRNRHPQQLAPAAP
jgi:peptidoglycan/LPS O-acetylase OafA/YrhL